MSAEQRNIRREAGMLVLGIVLGGVFSIISGLWVAYYVEWLKSQMPNYDWTFTLILTSISLVIVLVFLYLWARKQLRS
jgi:membrane protein implicated in regulation of membrane protease activity